MRSVTVKQLVDACDLTVYSGEEFLEKHRIKTDDISRPGLELTGYFDYYPNERVQIFGMTEISFSKRLSKENQEKVMARLCTPQTPCLVVARDLPIPEGMAKAASEKNIPILRTKSPTSRIASKITYYLQGRLATRQSLHGVLVDIYGLGVLITGDSGVGKSETALDLIKRGHRLIADDRVEVYKQDEMTIYGEPPQILTHLLEIRGVGIIDVMNLYGAGAVRSRAHISLIVHLENWSKDKQFDRLGSGEERQEILGVTIPKITIPVKVGRNMAIIVEAAAMNYRAKTMGYDATKKFDENLNNLIQEHSSEDQ
ncbi:HPr(Ser) kinase/phosphatase [Ligilactobacillus sp. LYQ135]